MPDNHYLALTVGPIYKTLANTRHTRELWAASYTFSYLMKGVADRMRKDTTRKFILPNLAEVRLFQAQNDGVGRFPDRLIFKTDRPKEDMNALKTAIAATIDDFACKVAGKISGDCEQVKIFCRDYFQFYIVQKTLADGDNPIIKISPDLEALELQRNFSRAADPFLENFLNNITTSFLVEDGFGRDTRFFETVIEIAARQFRETDDYKAVRKKRKTGSRKEEAKDDQDLVDNLLKKQGGAFLPAHKYIAIVHADGDKIGQSIEKIDCKIEGFVKEFQTFSEKLSAFSADAVGLISSYGGLPVYAGGDDLMFFAPVFNLNGRDKNGNSLTDIFSLLEKLNDGFVNKMGGASSLSFGLSISYYKFPLAEAVEISRNLMFRRAKETNNKNCVSFRVLKHSGAFFDGDFRIDSDSFRLFKKLLNNTLLTGEDILSSIMYKIRQNETLFIAVGADPDRIAAFIKNSFNEKIHTSDHANIEFLDAVKRLIPAVFRELTVEDFFTPVFLEENIGKRSKKEFLTERALQRVYALLRVVEFVAKKETKTPVIEHG